MIGWGISLWDETLEIDSDRRQDGEYWGTTCRCREEEEEEEKKEGRRRRRRRRRRKIDVIQLTS